MQKNTVCLTMEDAKQILELSTPVRWRICIIIPVRASFFAVMYAARIRRPTL